MLRRQILFSCWLLSLLLAVCGLKTDAVCVPPVCVNATYDAGSMTYELQVESAVGWVALGFGHRMANTHMIIMWLNENGNATLSQRYSIGHGEPDVLDSPPWQAVLIQARETVLSPVSTAVAFRVPVNRTAFDGEHATQSIIWAFSHKKPLSSDPSSTLEYHDARGALKLEFKSRDSNVDSVSLKHLGRRERLIILHGLLVSIGFLLFLPIGCLVARYTRSVTPKWIKFHETCNMYIALPVVTLGWILGPTVVYINRGLHLTDGHQWCGIVLLTLYYLQIWLGRFIHQHHSVKKSAHPRSHVIHVALGITIIGIALFQVRSGLNEWNSKMGRPVPEAFWLAWRLWTLILPLAYVGGLALLPRQFRQEKEMGGDYIALSDGSSRSSQSRIFGAEEDLVLEDGRDRVLLETSVPLFKALH
ncbi:hypothetical protein AX17_004400 [Amanita inopinata Kibby_2008]|nr:hypothetical protein AX17_004400 [Amanita inopinata Kibby_2008]